MRTLGHFSPILSRLTPSLSPYYDPFYLSWSFLPVHSRRHLNTPLFLQFLLCYCTVCSATDQYITCFQWTLHTVKDCSMKWLAIRERPLSFASVDVQLVYCLFILNYGGIYLKIASCNHPISTEYCMTLAVHSLRQIFVLWTVVYSRYTTVNSSMWPPTPITGPW